MVHSLVGPRILGNRVSSRTVPNRVEGQSDLALHNVPGRIPIRPNSLAKNITTELTIFSAGFAKALSKGGVAGCLLLVCALHGVGQAQQSPQPSTAPAPTAQHASTTDNPVVLKVGNVQVTRKDFEAKIGEFETEGESENESISEKDRRALGDDYASVLMLSQQAVADHMDSSPEIRRQLEVARVQVLSDAEFAKLIRQSEPTSKEIGDYYSAHLTDYDEVQIRRLFIWKRREGEKAGQILSSRDARAHAEKIRQGIAAGYDPHKLAEDLKNQAGGILDAEPTSFPRGELPAAMEKAAFALKEGEWSEVEDTPNSLILVQLVKRSRRPLGEVSSVIKTRLQGQKMQITLDALKKQTGVWMDEKYFAHTDDPDSLSSPKVQKSAIKQENGNENR
jgi:hypothetical protein